MAAALRRRTGEVEAQGAKAQVRLVDESPCPLFLIDEEGQRRRLRYDPSADTFSPRGSAHTFRANELLEIARQQPELLSPSALARPMVQDAVLGSALLVLGPGELSLYHPGRSAL